VTWFGTRNQAIVIAVLCAFVWWLAGRAAGHIYSSEWLGIWDAVVRLMFFCLVILAGVLFKQQARQRSELKRANEQLRSEIADRQAAEEGLRQAQAQIARIARITTMGELAASIAHEINQPLGSIVMTGDACLRWLAMKPPDLDEVRQAVEAIIRDGTRASAVLVRIRGFLRPEGRLRERLDINDVIREVIALLDGELRRNGVSLETDMHANLSPVVVDRVLLQQVILNLMINAIEAVRAVSNRARVLHIRTEEQPSGSIVVLVQDSGVGLDPEHSSRMFEPFYTTKVDGVGMGLTISRSIIEAHGGRLWAIANDGPGGTFCFTLPIDEGSKM
jgi:C4-dicarboxylate-specific signal transduction histidine kinase